MRGRTLLVPAAALLASASIAAGCGGSDGETAVAPPPKDPDAPATGTLRFFAYGDTMTEEMLAPFLEANPDIDLQQAVDVVGEAALHLDLSGWPGGDRDHDVAELDVLGHPARLALIDAEFNLPLAGAQGPEGLDPAGRNGRVALDDRRKQARADLAVRTMLADVHAQ